MDHTKLQEGARFAQNPPLFSEKSPNNQQPPASDKPANLIIPIQYQPYYDAPQGSVVSQGPVIQPPLHATFVPVQPTHASDYLCYSIFTMLCCCLPLGILALVYSIRTQDANLEGNSIKAQWYSNMARKFAHSALGIGIVLGVLVIVVGSLRYM